MKRSISLIRRLFTHELSGFLILGLLLRVVLMPYFISPYDIGAYQSALAYLISGNDPYALHASIYPPFIHFITFPLFTVAYRLGATFDFHSMSDMLTGTRPEGIIASSEISPLFLVLWKVPLLCFDLLTGVLIYCFVKEIAPNSKTPKRCFLIWLFNPFVLAMSYLNGSYDVVVGFFILLGAYFIFKNRYFSAGLSFGLGTLTKTSPIFIAIPLGVILLFREFGGSFSVHSFQANSRLFLRFAAGCFVPLVFFAPLFIEYTGLTYSGISQEIKVTGGLNQWFFAADSKVSYLVNQYIGGIETVFLYYPIICFAVALLLVKFLEFSRERILFTTVFFASLVYLFLPITVQPQYLLWIIPLLLVISSKQRNFIWPLLLLSIAGFFFYFSLQGPETFLYPLAMFTPLYSPQMLTNQIAAYQILPGVISPYLTQDLCILFGAIGFVGLVITILLPIKNLRMAGNNVK
jgi:hypothetical protein